MNVIEAARELGKALQSEPVYEAYSAAKLANDKDETLQKDISSFHAKRMELNALLAVDDKDTAAVSALNSELNALYEKITENPKMIAFEDAKAGMDEILKSINYIVTCAANGDDPMTCPEKDPNACGGSCATCGGCG